MKPPVAAALGAIAFLLVLLLGGALVAVTHLPVVGNVLGLFGIVAGTWLASRLASGTTGQRIGAGVVTPVVAVVLAVVMALRAGALGPGIVPYLVVVVMATVFGLAAGLQGVYER